MAGRALPACSRVLSFITIDNEHEIAARLGLPANARLLKLERVRQGADEPFALETCYLPAEEFSDFTRAQLERGSLFSILEHDHGVKLAYADEEIDATSADPHIAALLGIARALPLLRIRQVIYSAGGKPTVYVLGLYRSDRHRLLIRRFR